MGTVVAVVVAVVHAIGKKAREAEPALPIAISLLLMIVDGP